MKFKKKRVRQGKQKREVGYEKDNLHYSKVQQIIVGLENFRHIVKVFKLLVITEIFLKGFP